MSSTTDEVIEVIENFKTWAEIEDLFGSGANQSTGERVESHLLNLLYESEHFEAHDILFDYLDIMDEFSYSGFLDALYFTLDALQK